MLQRALGFALTLTSAGVGLSPETARAQSRSDESAWLRTESQHFEVHYLRALAPDLDRAVRSAERAYERISAFELRPRHQSAAGDVCTLRVNDARTGRGLRNQRSVAPPQPHRSRIVLPIPQGDAQLDPIIVHELTHLLVSEIILPGRGGDGGVPRWVQEGIANYIVGIWSDDDERLMRELVASGKVPALSLLTGNGGFANARLNDAVGHAAFDYIESRWGAASVRRFLNTLIVPRVDKTYDSVFDLTPAEFDAAFRQYMERRFGPVVR